MGSSLPLEQPRSAPAIASPLQRRPAAPPDHSDAPAAGSSSPYRGVHRRHTGRSTPQACRSRCFAPTRRRSVHLEGSASHLDRIHTDFLLPVPRDRPAMPFNKAAARGSLVGQPGANMVAPMPAVAVNRSRSPRTSGRLAPARMTPIVSSTTSFACRCTSFGTCSSVVSATKRASLSICCAICAFLLVNA